jgi:hypothetical protein
MFILIIILYVNLFMASSICATNLAHIIILNLTMIIILN